MKKKIKTIVALGTATVLTLAGVMMYSPKTKVYGEEELVKAEKTITDTITENVTINESSAKDKEETVYVITDANGNAEKKIVSTWLKNKGGEDTIEDVANLSGIENVKGDEEYTEGADGAITWKADGKDIYYTGNSEAELPVDVKVTYLLDGEEIDADDLAGKSGKVTIRFEYKNNTGKEYEINGKKETIKTPFLMVSGMILDTDKFQNVEVTNGKLISDGNREIVVGLGFPGMNENLNLKEINKNASIDFPESFEVTADVEDFSLMMTVTMGTSDVFSLVEISDDLDTGKLKETVDTLTSALSQLSDGTGKLDNGIGLLGTKMNEFTTQAGTFSEGVTTYTNGVDKCTTGASQIAAATTTLNTSVPQLVTGIGQLKSGTELLKQKISGKTEETTLLSGSLELKTGMTTLNKSMKKMYTSLGTNIKTYSENLAKLDAGIKEAKANLKTASDGVTQYKAGIEQLLAAVDQAQDANTKLVYYAKLTATYAQLCEVYDQMITGYEKLLVYEEQLGQCEGAVAALSSIKTQMDEGKLLANLKLLEDGTKSLSAGVSELSKAIDEQLLPGMTELATKTADLPEGVETLSTAMTELSTGLSTLAENSKTLSDGAKKIAAAGAQFEDGIAQLQDGSSQLDAGVKELNGKLTEKLSSLNQDDLQTVIDRVKASGTAAQEYNNFSGIAEGKTGSVKFIYRTASIEK